MEFIQITYAGETYQIYKDGIVYNNTSDQDIPQFIFNLRDWYIKEK